MPYTVELKPGEEKRILSGHPWVFANEVKSVKAVPGTPASNGDLADVYTSGGRFVGRGYINHLSKILVRIFIRDPETYPGAAFWRERIAAAHEFRQRIGVTGSCREVFAESDDLPGIVADRYGDLLSVQLLTFGAELHREEIFDALEAVFSPRGIYERSDAEVRKKEGLELRTGPVRGIFDPRTVIEENGLKLIADLENGQKTGYFLDQRENRLAVRRYSSGDVLDCFCNAGGFSMNAAAAGARSVTAADISERALGDVAEAAKLNGFSDIIKPVCCDVFDLLRLCRSQGRQFDTVILDPPAFAKSASETASALKGYLDINTLGMKLVRSGGFLVSSSCTRFVTGEMYLNMLKKAAAASGRRVRVVEIRTQSPDHPADLWSEDSSYLKFYVLNVI